MTQRQAANRFAVLIGVLGLVIVFGSVSLSLVEHTSLGFGFVWTMNTITTLGTEREPRDTAGRLILVALEVLGIGTLFYGLATLAEFFVSGQLSGAVAMRRQHKMIESFSEHYIVCGYGRVGRQVARDLVAQHADVVVIDHDPAHRETARSDGVQWLEGHASDDDVLIRAGIKRAAAVVACVDSDAENIFVTLSARELQAGILIVARASAEDAEKKLLRAGANRVISPYKTTGVEMARLALHPQIEGAIEVANYRVEQLEVTTVCAGAGRTVDDVRGHTVIVAIRRSGGELVPQPEAVTRIEPGDTLVALGTADALEELEQLFQPATVADIWPRRQTAQ